MTEIIKKAHFECDKCHAVVTYDSEDIQTEEEKSYEYRNYATNVIVTKTLFINCPICGYKTIIREETK